MATITRGPKDQAAKKMKIALDAFEKQYMGSVATLYRQDSVSIRVRIVDKRFAKMSIPDRHDLAWNFLVDRLDEDTLQQLSVLLLLSPAETKSSFMNQEFDDPIPSLTK
jgi:stress-induced morphogen